MTIDKILQLPSIKLEEFSDEQIRGFFKDVLNVTRPETGRVIQRKKKAKKETNELEAMRILKALQKQADEAKEMLKELEEGENNN